MFILLVTNAFRIIVVFLLGMIMSLHVLPRGIAILSEQAIEPLVIRSTIDVDDQEVDDSENDLAKWALDLRLLTRSQQRSMQSNPGALSRARDLYKRHHSIDLYAWQHVQDVTNLPIENSRSLLDRLKLCGNTPLSSAENAKLEATLRCTMDAIASSDVELYWSSALARGESLRKSVAEKLPEWIKSNPKTTDVTPRDSEHAFRMHWTTNCEPAWSGIALEASSAHIYQLRSDPTEVPRLLLDRALGQLMSVGVEPEFKQWFRTMQPPSSVQQEVADNGDCLIADFMLYIRHAEPDEFMIAPYFLRFWWDRVQGEWHPSDLYCATPSIKAKFIF